MCDTNGPLTHSTKKADRIYRVYTKGESDASAYMPGPLAPALAESFPTQMQHVVRIFNTSRTFQYGDHSFQERVIYVDPGFWDVFSFPLIKGDPATVLNRKDTIIISETVAQKFFGNTDPMGKSFSFTRNSKIHQALITGIVKDIPETSSIQFGCIQSYENVEDALNSWNYINNISTYVLLHDQVRSEDIEKLLPRFLNWSWPITGENQELKLQPLANVHFNPDIRAPEPATDPAYSYILLCITALVLFVACVNFMTLALGTVGFSRAGNRHPQSRWRTQAPDHRAIPHRIRNLKPHSICNRTRAIRTFNAIIQQPHGAKNYP